jgi:hypothetical protein
MVQNELWWFYYVFYFYISSSIIYCYCINYLYKDPPRIYTRPTTEPHENEMANKDDKKTEEHFHQTKISHQRVEQVNNIAPTQLVETRLETKNVKTKDIGITKKIKKSRTKELNTKIARAASQLSKELAGSFIPTSIASPTSTSTIISEIPAVKVPITSTQLSSTPTPVKSDTILTSSSKLPTNLKITTTLDGAPTVTTASTQKPTSTERLLLKLAFQKWKTATAIDKYNFDLVPATNAGSPMTMAYSAKQTTHALTNAT